MSLSLLRALDRWIGACLLYLLIAPARIASLFLPPRANAPPNIVFLKLKGGGSLMIAMPALLGLRRHYPDATFTLICASEAKIYAELTGLFDTYSVIDDYSVRSLLTTGFRALRNCFHATQCIDLEPNSWLAALFTMMSCATRRIGLVRPEQPTRAYAYTEALSFNAAAPIYVYYDRIAEMLGATPATADQCRAALLAHLPTPSPNKLLSPTIALAAFTSDFARERMMPPQSWADLLKQNYGVTLPDILILGSAKNKNAAQILLHTIQTTLPTASITNLAGTGSLAQAAAQMLNCDEIWAVDSGLLHIARLLGIPTRSYWGPTMPTQRLRPIDNLREHIIYRPFLCSPCIQSTSTPPCGGHNLCMISMPEAAPDLRPAWIKKR